MLARLKTSHDQAVAAKKALGPNAGSLALSHPQDFDDFDSEKAKSFTKQMQSALVAQQQQAELIEKVHSGAPAFGGYHPASFDFPVHFDMG